MDDDTQLWGIDDIAAALDVTSETVEQWHQGGERVRGEPMPKPTRVLNLGRTPVWEAPDIISWAVRTGRTGKLWRPKW